MVVVKMDSREEENTDDVMEEEEDDEEEEVPAPPATAEMAAPATATATASASMIAPMDNDRSWAVTSPLVEIGKDWTVVLTSCPRSMTTMAGSVTVPVATVVGGMGNPMSIEAPPPVAPIPVVLLAPGATLEMTVLPVGDTPPTAGRPGHVPGSGIRLAAVETVCHVPVPVPSDVPLMPEGVSNVQRGTDGAGRGEGAMPPLPPFGARVPMMDPSMMAPAQAGKQLAGPVTVPEMMPVTVPVLGMVTI